MIMELSVNDLTKCSSEVVNLQNSNIWNIMLLGFFLADVTALIHEDRSSYEFAQDADSANTENVKRQP